MSVKLFPHLRVKQTSLPNRQLQILFLMPQSTTPYQLQLLFVIICDFLQTSRKFSNPSLQINLLDWKRDSKPFLRTTSLLSVISRVLEMIIRAKMLKYSETYQLIHVRQYGFHHEKSTTDLPTLVADSWNKSLKFSLQITSYCSWHFKRL